ncbi:MAG: threonine/serine dehydratase [Roseiflexaceae bacterium]|nr:threonine/serine dehydratase [Roseiflexaceae bacterium]
MYTTLSISQVQAARERIAPHVRHTPLVSLPSPQGNMPPQLRLKLENLQVTGSFKARGAFNNLLQLSAQQLAQGIVTASGGNHGLAIAYAAAQLRTAATVYIPETASADREARIAAWGAQVIRFGSNPSDALAQARAHGAAAGLAFIHPFDAIRTLEGTGTLGLELLDDLPDIDYLLVAIGGGGLISGMAAAIKQQKPHVRIIGVEPVGAASMHAAVEAGHVVELADVRTIADTLAPRAVCDLTLGLTQQYVDEIILVDDRQMVLAMRWLWAECNQLVEPAGAAVIAALQSGAITIPRDAAPVALICGGNAAAESVFQHYS